MVPLNLALEASDLGRILDLSLALLLADLGLVLVIGVESKSTIVIGDCCTLNMLSSVDFPL